MRILNRAMICDAYPRPRILHIDGDRDVPRLAANALKSVSVGFAIDTIDNARRAIAGQVFDLAVIKANLASNLSRCAGLRARPSLRAPVIREFA